MRCTPTEYAEFTEASDEIYSHRFHRITQTRAQFSSRGLPLCGDRKYGAKADGPLGLWSYQIAFFHPQTNEHLVFTHDPPQAEPWLAFFDTLKEK